jgi:hypothetical protein
LQQVAVNDGLHTGGTLLLLKVARTQLGEVIVRKALVQSEDKVDEGLAAANCEDL